MSANGRLTGAELTVVQGDMRLAKAAASAWFHLEADVLSETGVDPLISPDGAYRSYEDQVRLTGTGYHQYRPGSSVHGLGIAVDINNWATIGKSRLDEIADRHGFDANTVKNEPWHYLYTGTANIEEDDMYNDADRARDQLVAGHINNLRSLPSTQAAFEQWTIDLYRNLLGRDPDAAGKASAMTMFNQGKSVGDVQAQIKASDEYKRRQK